MPPEQRAKRNAYSREYYQKNKEKCKAQSAEWRKKNAGKDSELAKKYRAKYSEKYKLIYRLGKEALDKMEAENGNKL